MEKERTIIIVLVVLILLTIFYYSGQQTKYTICVNECVHEDFLCKLSVNYSEVSCSVYRMGIIPCDNLIDCVNECG